MGGLLQITGQRASSHGASQFHSDDTWRWPEAQAVIGHEKHELECSSKSVFHDFGKLFITHILDHSWDSLRIQHDKENWEFGLVKGVQSLGVMLMVHMSPQNVCLWQIHCQDSGLLMTTTVQFSEVWEWSDHTLSSVLHYRTGTWSIQSRGSPSNRWCRPSANGGWWTCFPF